MNDTLTDTLIHYGSEIKSVAEDTDGWRFGGWLVVFDSPDVSPQRDTFTKSTDFDIEDGERRSVYFHHGLDGTIKRARLGDCRVFIKDAGVWIEGQIRKRNDYLKAHVERIAGNIEKFGLSSGAPAHLVERKAVAGGHEMLLWPLAEASITPCPAEPLAGCVSLKSLVEIEGGAEIKYDPRQPRDDLGRWSDGATGGGGTSSGTSRKSPLLQNVDKSKELRKKIKDNLSAIEKEEPGSEKHLQLLSQHADLQEEHARVLSDIADELEKRAASRKSNDNEDDTSETKHLDELEAALPDGLALDDHSLKVLAAVEELQERIASLADVRCVKSQRDGRPRRWSAEKYSRLNELAGGLSAVADEIKAIADAHAPRRAASPDAIRMLAQVELTRARLNGVPV